MRQRDSLAIIDSLYRDSEKGAHYHISSAIYNFEGELIGFTLISNNQLFNVTPEWMNTHIKSSRLQYLKTLNSDLGLEIDTINKRETIYVIRK